MKNKQHKNFKAYRGRKASKNLMENCFLARENAGERFLSGNRIQVSIIGIFISSLAKAPCESGVKIKSYWQFLTASSEDM